MVESSWVLPPAHLRNGFAFVLVITCIAAYRYSANLHNFYELAKWRSVHSCEKGMPRRAGGMPCMGRGDGVRG